MLRARADVHPETVGLRYYDQGEVEGGRLTYADLDARARSIAVMLGARARPGDRVLLMFPPGLDFLCSFWACLYAGIIAVPAYPPDIHRLEHAVRRLQAILDDATPALVLTTSEILGMAKPLAAGVKGAERLLELPWVSCSEADPAASATWAMPDIGPATLPFLQYTSGSTGNPKGAMLSNANLLSDVGMLLASFQREPAPLDSVCWVPLYHDLGIIGHVLTSLTTGGTCHIMSPLDFLKKPLRWLRLLSDTRAELTGAPNFGYDLCVRKISREEAAGLDLSHLAHAGNCAEPVRARPGTTARSSSSTRAAKGAPATIRWARSG